MDGKKESSPFEMMYRDRRARRIAHALLANRMSAERVASCLTSDDVWANALKLTEALFKGKSGMNYKHVPSLDTRAWVIAYMAMDAPGRGAVRNRVARDLRLAGVEPRAMLEERGQPQGFGDWDVDKKEWEYPLL